MKSQDSTKFGTLVVLPCHCVYDKVTRNIYSEHPEDRLIYEAHIHYAFRHVEWRMNESPMLVISGGFTRNEIRLSESRSYLSFAQSMGIEIAGNVILEEYALVSIENLLFSLYVYNEARGCYPETIDVISWRFKEERFKATLEAINRWSRFHETIENLNLFPVGDLLGESLERALLDEKSYIHSLERSLEDYYEEPATKELIRRRDVYRLRKDAELRYRKFPLPWREGF